MDQMKKSEMNSTSDSEDFFDDYWFLSSSASHDGSSVNSIPWADDVVKQNQELWDRVERMFYGEESLPDNDPKLAQEIREWTTHFPYFRVSGSAMAINARPSIAAAAADVSAASTTTAESYDAIPSDPHFEEIFAIHPSPELSTCKSAAVMCATARPLRPSDSNSMREDQLANDIEKYLRITSGPLLSRRTQNSRTAYHYRNNDSHATNLMQNKSKWQPSSNRHSSKPQLKSALVHSVNVHMGAHYARKLHSSIDTERVHSVPYSARIIKVPALTNQTRDFRAIPVSSSSTSIAAGTAIRPNFIRIKTATLVPISRPLRNSITLPAIKIEPQYFDRSSCNDAISAIIYPNANIDSPKKTLKKRSESE